MKYYETSPCYKESHIPILPLGNENLILPSSMIGANPAIMKNLEI
jgi:hypothetical protein